MAYTKFTQFGRKDASFISLTKSQSFGFGGDFLEKYNLESKEYVELLYDQDEKKVAFHFIDEKTDKGAFKLISSKGTKSKLIVARSFFTTFFKANDIVKYEGKYLPEVEEDPEYGQLFSIKLKEKEDPIKL